MWQVRGIHAMVSLLAAGDRNWEGVPAPCQYLELGLKQIWNQAPEELPHFFKKLEDDVVRRRKNQVICFWR